MKFAFIRAEKARWPIEVQCEVFEVSRGGYYAWTRRPASPRAVEDAALIVEIKVAHKTGIAPHFAWNRILIDEFGQNLRITVPRSAVVKQPDLLDHGRLRSHVTFVYFVFPCSFISILPDHASFITFLPDGLGNTSVESHVLVPRRGDEEPSARAARGRSSVQ